MTIASGIAAKSQSFLNFTKSPDFHFEGLLPIESSEFTETEYQLITGRDHEAISSICGIRLHESATLPTGEPTPETTQCRADLAQLILAIRKLRSTPEFRNTIISNSRITADDKRGCIRLRVGLEYGLPKHENETASAQKSHARLMSHIYSCGYSIVSPKALRSDASLADLAVWCETIELRRRRSIPWPMLLLAILLLLIPFCLPSCEFDSDFAGLPVRTSGVILVLDKSGSMREPMEKVRHEANRLLSERKSSWATTHAELIYFDEAAHETFGSLKKCDTPTILQLMDALAAIRASGGNAGLKPAIEAAVRDAARLDCPTTIILFSDGVDNSLPVLIKDIELLRAAAGKTPITIHAIAPRDPSNQLLVEHRQLQILSTTFGGQFKYLD